MISVPTPLVELTVDDLRDRCVELAAVEAQLEEALEDVRQAQVIARAQLHKRAREDMDRRPLGVVAERERRAPAAPAPAPIASEDVRDAIVKFGRFVLDELAAELGCSTRQAAKELAKFSHLVTQRGRIAGKKAWEYVAPDGPGEAFLAQQRLAPPVSRELPVIRDNQDIAQSLIGMVTPKQLREVAREAIAAGWTLKHGSGKHPMRLVREGRAPVGLASTPTNPDGAAKAVRRKLGL
jgi:hypothetical protein